MYGIYGDIIDAAKRALSRFDETQDLLEYPEVQADKAYYLSVLSKYRDLKTLRDMLENLTFSLREEKEFSLLLADAKTSKERDAIYEEISLAKKKASEAAAKLCDMLGCKHAAERVYCRFKLKEISSKFGAALFTLIKSYLTARGAKIEDERLVSSSDKYLQDISFIAEGEDVLTRLMPFTGAHKVYIAQAKSEELCFAATPAARTEKALESDLKIDLFHSSGAGGQNVNKVETAVRVTHLPTGLAVVCQDERSQLKNKRRAIETIEKRLNEKSEQEEKKRMDADICAQFSKKNTPLSFDAAGNTLTDTRLKAFAKISFPLTNEQFASYIDGLIAL